jgi:hypothetical protein
VKGNKHVFFVKSEHTAIFWLIHYTQMGATDNKSEDKQRLIPKLTADGQNGDSTTVKETESERLARINKGGSIFRRSNHSKGDIIICSSIIKTSQF